MLIMGLRVTTALAIIAALGLWTTVHLQRAEWTAGIVKHTSFAEVHAAPVLVAHAGGGTTDGSYSNSLEAIEESYAAGIRWFEIDVWLTGDGHAVLLHNVGPAWDHWFTGGSAATLADFEAAEMRGGRTQLSLASFCEWLLDHPDVHVFLDVKVRERELVEAAARVCPDVLHQLIPFLGDPFQGDPYLAETARDLGFTRLSVKAYAAKLELEQLAPFAATNQFEWIGLAADRFDDRAIAEAITWGVDIVIHSINDPATAERLLEIGVAAIMTDVLRPHTSHVATAPAHAPCRSSGSTCPQPSAR